jgi:hypothetical protein
LSTALTDKLSGCFCSNLFVPDCPCFIEAPHARDVHRVVCFAVEGWEGILGGAFGLLKARRIRANGERNTWMAAIARRTFECPRCGNVQFFPELERASERDREGWSWR